MSLQRNFFKIFYPQRQQQTIYELVINYELFGLLEIMKNKNSSLLIYIKLKLIYFLFFNKDIFTW